MPLDPFKTARSLLSRVVDRLVGGEPEPPVRSAPPSAPPRPSAPPPVVPPPLAAHGAPPAASVRVERGPDRTITAFWTAPSAPRRAIRVVVVRPDRESVVATDVSTHEAAGEGGQLVVGPLPDGARCTVAIGVLDADGRFEARAHAPVVRA